MTKLNLSPTAAGLLRALLARAGVDRDRILLTDFWSIDWQSLTFIGERHEIQLRIVGPSATAIAARMTADLAEADDPRPLATPALNARRGQGSAQHTSS